MPASRSGVNHAGNVRMQQLMADTGESAYGAPVAAAEGEKDEFGRIIQFTGTGFGDKAVTAHKADVKTSPYDSAGFLVSYGAAAPAERKGLADGDARARIFGMSERTLPGDLLTTQSEKAEAQLEAARAEREAARAAKLEAELEATTAKAATKAHELEYSERMTAELALGEQRLAERVNAAAAKVEADREAVDAERAAARAELAQWKAAAREEMGAEREGLVAELARMREAGGLARENESLLAERDGAARRRARRGARREARRV